MMKTMPILMLSLLSITFTVDAEAAKKSKAKSHRSSHAALKHHAAKKKAHASKRKPAMVKNIVTVSEKVPLKHEHIDMTAALARSEQQTVATRDLATDPHRPLTW